jgi:hypothetical protein
MHVRRVNRKDDVGLVWDEAGRELGEDHRTVARCRSASDRHKDPLFFLDMPAMTRVVEAYRQHLGGFARREQLDRGEWERTARWLD